MTRAKERSFSDDQPSSASTATAPVSAFAFGARSGESNPNVLPCIDRHRHTRVVGGGKHNSVLSSSSVANDSTLAARGSVDSAPRRVRPRRRPHAPPRRRPDAPLRRRPESPPRWRLTHPLARRLLGESRLGRLFLGRFHIRNLRRLFVARRFRRFRRDIHRFDGDDPPSSVRLRVGVRRRPSLVGFVVVARDAREERGEERSFASTSRIVSPPSTAAATAARAATAACTAASNASTAAIAAAFGHVSGSTFSFSASMETTARMGAPRGSARMDAPRGSARMGAPRGSLGRPNRAPNLTPNRTPNRLPRYRRVARRAPRLVRRAPRLVRRAPRFVRRARHPSSSFADGGRPPSRTSDGAPPIARVRRWRRARVSRDCGGVEAVRSPSRKSPNEASASRGRLRVVSSPNRRRRSRRRARGFSSSRGNLLRRVDGTFRRATTACRRGRRLPFGVRVDGVRVDRVPASDDGGPHLRRRRRRGDGRRHVWCRPVRLSLEIAIRRGCAIGSAIGSALDRVGLDFLRFFRRGRRQRKPRALRNPGFLGRRRKHRVSAHVRRAEISPRTSARVVRALRAKRPQTRERGASRVEGHGDRRRFFSRGVFALRRLDRRANLRARRARRRGRFRRRPAATKAKREAKKEPIDEAIVAVRNSRVPPPRPAIPPRTSMRRPRRARFSTRVPSDRPRLRIEARGAQSPSRRRRRRRRRRRPARGRRATRTVRESPTVPAFPRPPRPSRILLVDFREREREPRRGDGDRPERVRRLPAGF